MNSKTPNDARTPDQVTQTLRKGFAWTTMHSNIVIIAVIAFVVLGLGLSLAGYLSEKKEVAQQEKYFLLERAYTDKKDAFAETSRAELLAAQDKKAPAVDPAKKPSGDITKDYGTVVTDLESFVDAGPKTQAAQMAALNLTDLYMKYKTPDSALAVLQKVEPGLDKKEVLSALVHIQWGNVLAQKGDCAGAIPHWERVTSVKAFAYAHDEARLRMGFCYQSMNDLAKAEQVYTEITKADGSANRDFAASREAEKYLRLIKAKKNL